MKKSKANAKEPEQSYAVDVTKGVYKHQQIMHDYAGATAVIVFDGGQQMGMPHRRFQGRTGLFRSSWQGMGCFELKMVTCKRPLSHAQNIFDHWSDLHG